MGPKFSIKTFNSKSTFTSKVGKFKLLAISTVSFLKTMAELNNCVYETCQVWSFNIRPFFYRKKFLIPNLDGVMI